MSATACDGIDWDAAAADDDDANPYLFVDVRALLYQNFNDFQPLLLFAHVYPVGMNLRDAVVVTELCFGKILNSKQNFNAIRFNASRFGVRPAAPRSACQYARRNHTWSPYTAVAKIRGAEM